MIKEVLKILGAFLLFVLTSCGDIGFHKGMDLYKPSEPLSYAASKGDIAEIRRIVNSKESDVNYKNRHGDTALHVAAHHCQAKSIEALIELGANINQRDIDQDQPIHKAATKSHCDKAMKMLLDKGAEINSLGRNNRTAIIKAVDHGYDFDTYDVIKLLKYRGADLSITDQYGNTPLEIAKNKLKEKEIYLEQKKKEGLAAKARGEKYYTSDFSYVEEKIKKYREILKLLKS